VRATKRSERKEPGLIKKKMLREGGETSGKGARGGGGARVPPNALSQGGGVKEEIKDLRAGRATGRGRALKGK